MIMEETFKGDMTDFIQSYAHSLVKEKNRVDQSSSYQTHLPYYSNVVIQLRDLIKDLQTTRPLIQPSPNPQKQNINKKVSKTVSSLLDMFYV